MKDISPKEASATHPGLADRLHVITIGWSDGGSSGAARGLKDKMQPPSASPQTALVTPPTAKPPPPARCDGVEAQVGNERRCLKPKDTFKDCPECPEMVVVPAGSFIMGASPAEIEALAKEYPGTRTHYDRETPQHRVTITKSIAVGRFEVTFAEWDACVTAGGCIHKPRDFGWGRGRRPVIDISWNHAKEFVGWLSKKTNKTYRLLTEAEWERRSGWHDNTIFDR